MSHLIGLGTFKFVNVKFTDAKRDSSLLNTNIYLTPFLKKSIRLEFQAVSKSNNFVGPGFSLTFTNRNFLKGAELFQLKLTTGYEAQISRQQSGVLNSFELGAEASLAVHRFITPFSIPYHSSRYLPQTQFKLGYNLQQRVGYFQLNSLTASFGYTWRESTSKTHTFYPVDINYVKLSNTSAKFDSIVNENPFLAKAFENQFIPGMRYSFTLNTQLQEHTTDKFSESHGRLSNFYFNGNLELAGNLLHLAQQKLGNTESTPYTIMGSSYSQYIRTDIDFRYYLQLDRHNKIATRFLAGLGYPFGNSTTLPYIKQFSIGGANSIRAFPARSLGPGTYNVRTDTSVHTKTFFIDQRADIKLEGNVEYRFDIIKALKGALFVDGGNIWLLNDEQNRPGGKFKADTFLDELAIGTGAGLRFDFNFFVLRFDLGFPLRKPFLPPANRWVINEIDFGSSTWRNENLLFNIAIGYPF
jgi:outer membrane protein assembly factor BamA